jgi:hypothetical protein
MLKLLNDSVTLVVAGAWNPDILSPSWVAKEALALQLDQNFPVNVQLPIGNPTQRPIFEFAGVRYLAAKGGLTFYLKPDDANQIATSIGAVTKILGLLLHTPITGFGFNFSYEIENPAVPLLETFSSSNILASFLDNEATQTVGQGWSSSVITDDQLLNLGAELAGGKIRVDFNVHYEVNSAAAASQKLQATNLFSDIKNTVSGIAQHLHDLGEQQ